MKVSVMEEWLGMVDRLFSLYRIKVIGKSPQCIETKLRACAKGLIRAQSLNFNYK